MFQIGVIRHFSSAHHLRGYKGKCEALHGHNWKVEAQVRSEKLDHLGMVVDFGDLKTILDALLDELDHTLINDHPYFKEHNPSSEELARFLFERLKDDLPAQVEVASVKVWESPGSFAIYTRST